MNKRQVAEKLSGWCQKSHIQGWLSKFPKDHVFDKDYHDQFIDYINKSVFPGDKETQELLSK